MESLQERNIISAISESVFKTWMYWNGSFQLWKIVNEIYFSLEGGIKMSVGATLLAFIFIGGYFIYKCIND